MAHVVSEYSSILCGTEVSRPTEHCGGRTTVKALIAPLFLSISDTNTRRDDISALTRAALRIDTRSATLVEIHHTRQKRLQL